MRPWLSAALLLCLYGHLAWGQNAAPLPGSGPDIPFLSAPLAPQYGGARGLGAMWMALPGRIGGPGWYDLVGKIDVTLTNMTTVGTTGWGPTTRFGGFGEVRFNGGSTFAITSAPSGLNDLTQKTLMAWVKLNSFGAGSLARIINKFVSAGSAGWFLQVNNSEIVNGISFYQGWGGGTAKWGVPNVLSTGVWTHVAMTYDNNSSANVPVFYVNGAQTAAATVITALSGSLQSDAALSLYLGNTDDGTRGFDGAMDDIRIYRRLLSASEIKMEYDQARRGYPDMLVMLAPKLPPLASIVAAPSLMPFLRPSRPH